MILAHKIELKPNNNHRTAFAKACGVSRYAYNWGLNKWTEQYKSGGRPKANDLKKQWNKVKPEWVYESPKGANQQPFANLNRAFQKFFKKQTAYPKFKRKGVHDSFAIENDKFHVSSRYVRLPKTGSVKMTERLRFVGKIMGAVVSREADRWFISITVDAESKIKKNRNVPVQQKHGDEVIGVDLGVTSAATLSNGEKFDAPKPLKKMIDILRRRSRQHSRKQKGSKNRKKSQLRLSRLHRKIRCQRQDFLHKLTSMLHTKAKCVVIEDLNVKGMMSNRHLSRAISDIGFGEFRRQLEYKRLIFGAEITIADRWFPSTKTCNSCGLINDMPLSQRTYACECGYIEDRDINAAKNLRNLYPGLQGNTNACGHGSSGFGATQSETTVAEAGISVCAHKSTHRK